MLPLARKQTWRQVLKIRAVKTVIYLLLSQILPSNFSIICILKVEMKSSLTTILCFLPFSIMHLDPTVSSFY